MATWSNKLSHVTCPACCSEQTVCFLGGALSSLMPAPQCCANCDGSFLHPSLGSAKSSENAEHLWKILNTFRLSCLFFIWCLCCIFWYNKQGKSNEVNSARFKEFLTNEQCLTVFCFENVNPSFTLIVEKHSIWMVASFPGWTSTSKGTNIFHRLPVKWRLKYLKINT